MEWGKGTTVKRITWELIQPMVLRRNIELRGDRGVRALAKEIGRAFANVNEVLKNPEKSPGFDLVVDIVRGVGWTLADLEKNVVAVDNMVDLVRNMGWTVTSDKESSKIPHGKYRTLILEALADGSERNWSELAKSLKLSRSKVLYHLKGLRKDGLVRSERRDVKIVYSLVKQESESV